MVTLAQGLKAVGLSRELLERNRGRDFTGIQSSRAWVVRVPGNNSLGGGTGTPKEKAPEIKQRTTSEVRLNDDTGVDQRRFWDEKIERQVELMILIQSIIVVVRIFVVAVTIFKFTVAVVFFLEFLATFGVDVILCAVGKPVAGLLSELS